MVLANRGYNSLFDNMFRDPFYGRSQERTETQVMRTDIYEKDGNYLLRWIFRVTASLIFRLI